MNNEKFEQAMDSYNHLFDLAETATNEELFRYIDEFVAVFGKDQLTNLLLIDALHLSDAGYAAQLMIFLWLHEEEHRWAMCQYLRQNPNATEGQILWKCRQLLGESR